MPSLFQRTLFLKFRLYRLNSYGPLGYYTYVRRYITDERGSKLRAELVSVRRHSNTRLGDRPEYVRTYVGGYRSVIAPKQ